MSDTTPWAAPGGSDAGTTPPPAAFPPPAAPAAVPQPSFPPPSFPPPGGFPPPVAGAPLAPPTPFPTAPAGPYGPAAAAPPGAPGWTPPPKPGLIPLRPLTFGTLLGASFQVLRRNPRPMFGFSLLLTGGVFVVTLLGIGFFTFLSVSRIATAVGPDVETITAGAVAGMILSTLIPIGLSVAVIAILQGVVVLEVARGTLGEKLTLRGLLRAARGRLGALVGWALLATTIVVVAITLVVLLVVVLVTFGGSAGLGIGIALAVLASLASVALAFWLWTRLCLVPSVLVLERLPLRHAIRRAWSLTTGYFWKTLGIQLLVAVILSTVSSIVSAPLSIVFTLGVGLFSPTGDVESTMVIFVIFYILSIVVSLVVSAISSVVQSATTGLIYIDIRMRKEGLDLELSRFVEARQAGDTSVADPYLLRRPEPVA